MYWQEPGFFERVAGRAMKVVIGLGTSQTRDLTMLEVR